MFLIPTQNYHLKFTTQHSAGATPAAHRACNRVAQIRNAFSAGPSFHPPLALGRLLSALVLLLFLPLLVGRQISLVLRGLRE